MSHPWVGRASVGGSERGAEAVGSPNSDPSSRVADSDLRPYLTSVKVPMLLSGSSVIQRENAKGGIEVLEVRHGEVAEADPSAQSSGDELARRQAIKQIQRRRRFRIEAVTSAIAMIALVAIWATSEYHNAGGWPTHGFSQSSGIHDVWNFWIIYPIMGWVLLLG